MVVNLVMQLIPILEIVESRQPSKFGNETHVSVLKKESNTEMEVYVYDPNRITW